MRHTAPITAALLVVALLQASSVADEPQTKVDKLLQVVRIPAKALPKGLHLVKRIGTAPLIPIKRNPDAFVEPARIKSIALFFGMRDQQELALVRAGVTAIYQENKPANELGVYGLLFSDKLSAARWFKKLTNGKQRIALRLEGQTHALRLERRRRQR
jgi:hypothetical protein